MKVIINTCFGCFSLSPKAVKRMAEINGRECYFFRNDFKTDTFTPISEKEATGILWFAFDIPNPGEVIGKTVRDSDGTYKTHNERYNKHHLTNRPENRTDPVLVQVVEELGGEHRGGASGSCAELKIVEIPDGIEWEIDEYDGLESIHEVHRSWS